MGAVAALARPQVLVADDDGLVRRSMQRLLESHGYAVVCACDGSEALKLAESRTFDAIVTDLAMPGRSGTDLLQALRERAISTPVLIVAGAPSTGDAQSAAAWGARRLLRKPVRLESLLSALREVTDAPPPPSAARLSPAERSQALTRALATATTAYQPVVDARAATVFGHEALLRSAEPLLPTPLAVIAAAEALGRLFDVGRVTRARVASLLEATPTRDLGAVLVNAHPADLGDPDLYDASAPLSRHASRVIIEITERERIADVTEARAHIASLRAMGYRVAVDDVGGGYSGLSSLVDLEPDLAKIDMSLVRGIHDSKIKRGLVRAIVGVCAESGIQVVCEGVETREERACLEDLGPTLMQGYLFARPGPPLPTPRF